MCIYHLYKEEGQGRTIWGLSLVFRVQKGRNRTERHRHTNTQYGEWRRKHWEKGALEGKRPAGHSVLELKLLKFLLVFTFYWQSFANSSDSISTVQFHIYTFFTYHIICLCYIHIYLYTPYIFFLNTSLIVLIINTERQTTRGRRQGQKPESGIKRRFKACAWIPIFGFLIS